MRIAVVSEQVDPSSPAGGARAVHVTGLAAALARSGHEVVVHSPGEGRVPAQRVRTEQGYEVARVPGGPPERLGDVAEHLERAWVRWRPDVVHAHSWTSGLAAALAARSTGVPLVLTFHGLGGSPVPGRGPDCPAARAGLERVLGRQAAHVVATSDAEARDLIALGVARSKVTVVPCGFDPALFSPEGPVAERRSRHRVVTTGRPGAHRGFGDLVTALRSLPDAELVIAGGPVGRSPEVRELRGLAERYGVDGRLRLLGPVPHAAMPALLRSADVVACVPREEPSGLVAVEAMACRVPVVASAVGALADSVVDGVTGTLVPPDDPVGLARVLRSLLVDAARRDAYGTAGADRAAIRYTLERVARDTERVYAAVTGTAPAADLAPAAPGDTA
ncbi:glycosyltransferase [Saccharothrix sp. Mg75]|uniref:glycosyltransferase n=1 Tax=Saccharothrix sp. Mg75 TaxID=3445357 RepID=UPI003EEB378A